MPRSPKNVTIRHPQDAEREQLIQLIVNTFRSDPTDARKWGEKLDLNEVLCLLEGPRIVSSITVNALTALVGGRPVGLGGIGGVMTAADRQGRGYAGRVMTEGFKLMRSRGQAISTLYPFSYVYYGRLGYALACDHLIFPELTQRDLPRYEEFRLVDRWLPGEPLDPLVGPHNRIMARYNLTCQRTLEGWQKVVARLDERKSFLYVVREKGKILGWFVAGNQRREQGHESQTQAMALGDRTAFKAMIGMLARLPTNVKKIGLHLPPDFELWDVLGEPARATRHADLQARIIDMPAALRCRGYQSGAAGKLTFRLTDELARWNHGTWQARWAGGELASIDRLPASGATKAPSPTGGLKGSGRGGIRIGLLADIASFAQIYTGYRSARVLAELGKIQASSPAVLDLLDELFHDQPTHTQDWF